MTAAATAAEQPRGPGRPRQIDSEAYSKRNFRVLDEDWAKVCEAAGNGSPSGTDIVRAALRAAASGVDVVGILAAETVRRTQ